MSAEIAKTHRCHNCRYAGPRFRWVDMTYHMCEYPGRYSEEDDPRDAVRAWHDTCEQWQGKEADNAN